MDDGTAEPVAIFIYVDMLVPIGSHLDSGERSLRRNEILPHLSSLLLVKRNEKEEGGKKKDLFGRSVDEYSYSSLTPFQIPTAFQTHRKSGTFSCVDKIESDSSRRRSSYSTDS